MAAQLGQAERLGDVVIGAGIECGDLLAFVVARRQHQHRNLRPLPQRAQHLEPLLVGQAQVEQHELAAVARQLRQAGAAVGGERDTIPLRAQADVEEAPHLRLVVDDQHERAVAAAFATRAGIHADASAGTDRGRRMQICVPVPSAPPSARTSPPCARIAARLIASPSPLPSRPRSPRATL
jgi:hypothetical protein